MREAGTDSGIGGISYTKAPVKGRPMPKTLVSALVLLLVAAPVSAAGPELKTEEQKTLYALGLALSQSLSTFALSDKELELVKRDSRTAYWYASTRSRSSRTCRRSRSSRSRAWR